jgi:hypothetical protein
MATREYDMFEIVEQATLESKYLDSNIYSHIVDKIEKDKIGKCTKMYGFAKSVRDVEIVSSEISMADGSNKFLVRYILASMLPEPKKMYVAKKLLSIVHHGDFNGAILTIDDGFQMIISNGIVKNKRYIFKDCPCFLESSGPCDLKVVVDCAIFKDGQYKVMGRHDCC